MTRSFLAAICVLSFCSISYVAAVQFSDCGSITGKVASVSVSGCADDASSCVLKRGSTEQFTINFKDLQEVSSIKAVVHGVIGGVPLPFPLPQTNGCQNSGLQCPLVSGKMYSYSTSIPILESYPPISVKVKWELQDASSLKDVVCIEIEAKLE